MRVLKLAMVIPYLLDDPEIIVQIILLGHFCITILLLCYKYEIRKKEWRIMSLNKIQ